MEENKNVKEEINVETSNTKQDTSKIETNTLNQDIQKVETNVKREISKNISLEKTYLTIIKSHPLYVDASKIVHWRDPIKSGLIFGIFNFFYFLVYSGEYTPLTLISYLLLTLLCVCFAFAHLYVLRAQWFQGKKVGNPFKERFKNETFHISKQQFESHMETVLDFINLTIDHIREIYYCTNTLLTLKWMVIFYVVAQIGNFLSELTIIYMVLLVLFIWPRLYEEKKAEIDNFYESIRIQFQNYLQLIISKLPPNVTNMFPQLKQKKN